MVFKKHFLPGLFLFCILALGFNANKTAQVDQLFFILQRQRHAWRRGDSGLIAYEDLIPDMATVQVLDKDVLSMMMAQDSTYFAPGSQYRYSDSGYAVLAMVIEKISGLLPNGKALDYGFGWRIDQYNNQPRLWHTGSTSGFRNVIQRYPEAKFTAIILTNRAEPEVSVLADKLTDLFL
jgi:CubicO group peptidase (beta-lactamase class C family)